MVAAGKRSRKWPTESAMELMCPGVPVTAWASIRPFRSKMPAETSPASRVEVLNAVRTSVCACSSTTASRRFHITCSRMSRLVAHGSSFRVSTR